MTVFDILRGLKEADNDAQSICSQAINDYSPYIKVPKLLIGLDIGK